MLVHVICDDSALEGLEHEHGFSAVTNTILFDTGKTDVFLKNLKKMHMEVPKNVVISHGHYDHIGGLAFLSNKRIWIRKEALFPKYSGNKYAGYPHDWNDVATKNEVIFVEDRLLELEPGVFLIGPVNLRNDVSFGEFYVEKSGTKQKDLFEDEQTLILTTEEGLVVITGCSHRGIDNIVLDISEIFNKSIQLLIGGFHLLNASEKRIEKIVKVFNDLRIKGIAPCHCTGNRAIEIFKEKFSGTVLTCKAGVKLRV
ncbi:MBL fold metallo-hydrolase [Thermotoga sp. KOL6]|uniref:MBL fold metallo-hydrolase n=1 Tax=Thermotoga sp. KOL6 TaxID=126741 RepID=UPI000C793652|nr:MBL fold metallo-hydrolase [Thermotoga sp. KOL6]PLV60328.1 MBL fold metallo-hydrolase [Thermotoga sp. KOL6]